MSLLRAFIAVELPPAIQSAAEKATSALRAQLGGTVRWVPVQNIHLTLKFLGDISPSRVDALTHLLRAEADLVPAFDIHVSGLGSFPNLKMPRVLWAGIQAPAEMEALYWGIESACRRMGFESEPRDFSPHLTLGRVKQDASAAERSKIRRALEAATIDSLGTAKVHSVHLFKSDLKKSGAVYTKLFTAPLHHVIARSHEVATKQSHLI